jgi:hypothetical protein
MKTRSERQVEALIELRRSRAKGFPDLKWKHRSLREPQLHFWWRLHESLVRRISLYKRAGLLMDPVLEKLLREHRREARKALKSWQAYAKYMNLRTKG